jgi:hypothetical protein
VDELFTVETFAKKNNLTRQSAINKISQLKKRGVIQTTGGGKQKRIYKLSNTKPTNGFYDIVNRYTKEKLVPEFKHYTYGKYSIENAIIDGLKINNTRTRTATMHLFRHINNWKRLFDLAKKHKKTQEVLQLYKEAKNITKVKRIPKRYL